MKIRRLFCTIVLLLMALSFTFTSCSKGSGTGGTAASDPAEEKEVINDDNPLSPDTTAPKITSVTVVSQKSIKVEFDESIDKSSAGETSNYALSSSSKSVGISQAEASDKSVDLSLSDALESGLDYSFLVKGIKDLAGNEMGEASKSVQYKVSVNSPKDSNNDGDTTDPDDDNDGDGISNKSDPDDDNDGATDDDEKSNGTDPNKPNGVPSDNNNDGDLTDPEDDLDGDGILNKDDDDADGDGIPNTVEEDTGSDPLDADSDDDGIIDSVDSDLDLDGDGIPNSEDNDADGDGIPNDIEEESGSDPYNPDTDNDGIIDSKDEDVDSDGDGEGNNSDQDADNDGISNDDEIASGSDPFDPDTDNDGVPDGVDSDIDSDGDGIPNSTDNDADGDGITNEQEEASGSNPLNPDSDGDGVIDSADEDLDSDGDGISNADEDSDGDGLTNGEEAGSSDIFDSDSDDDGIPDSADPDLDSDGDGVSNADEDSDGDGVSNLDEFYNGTDSGNSDIDGDGIPNSEDTDMDGDGIDNDVDKSPTGTETVLVLTTLPSNPTKENSAEITVTGENISAYKYALDSSSYSEQVSVDTVITLDSISDGSHTVSVYGMHPNGHWQEVSAAVSFTWVVDTTAPSATLANVPANVTTEGSAAISVVGAYAYKYKLNSSSWSDEMQGTLILTDLSDNDYTLKVIARDEIGNWNQEGDALTASWQVITTSPVAILEGVPDSSKETNATSVTAAVSGADLVSYKYSLDGGAWSEEITIAETPLISLSSLSEGAHTLSVIAKNVADVWQSEAEATSASWTIDTTPPTVSIVEKPANRSASTKPVIKVSGDDLVSYQYSFNSGESWSSSIAAADAIPFSTNLTEGSYTLTIKGKDDAGNQTAASNYASYSWNVDLTPPVAQFISGQPASPTNVTSASVSVGGDDVQSYKYSLDGSSYGAETSVAATISLSSLGDASYTLYVIAKDTAGNWQLSPSTISWSVDTQAPSIVLSNLPADLTSSNSADITVSVVGSSSYEYRLDNASWTALSSTYDIELSSLTEGEHSLIVRSSDAAGNTNTLDAISWTVDMTASTAVLEAASLPESITNITSFNVVVGGEDVVAYQYSLDGTNYNSETESSIAISLASLDDGDYTLYVKAKDSAGNWQETATSYSWTVDTIAPVATFSSVPASPTNATELSATVSGAGLAAWKWELGTAGENGEFDINDTDSLSLGELGSGSYNLKIWGRDAAGNWQASPTSYTFTVDRDAPTISNLEDSGATKSGTTLDFTWSIGADVTDVKIQVATDENFSNIVFGDGEGASLSRETAYTYSVNTINGSTYYARVKASDSLGNWSDYTSTDGITIVGSLAGEVYDTDGNAVEGAEVELLNASDLSLVERVTTGSDGSLNISDIEVGNQAYTLSVTASGYIGTAVNGVSINAGIVSNQGRINLVAQGKSSGKFSGNVIDANDGDPIVGATVEILDYTAAVVDTQTSGSGGSFTTKTLDPGTYSVKVTYNGYFDLEIANKSIDGNLSLGNLAACEVLPPYQLRVVVQWGLKPTDLDLHLVGPTDRSGGRFHIYWNVKSFDEETQKYFAADDPYGAFSTASLVQDDTSSYGPEAINIFEGYKYGVYTYTVHNWSSSNWYASNIVIYVYDSEGKLETIPFPTGAPNQWFWKAFQIDIQGPERADKTLAIVNEFATLTYSNTSSMDWQASEGGIQGFIMSVARGRSAVIAGLFAFFAALFAGFMIYSRKRSKDLSL